MTDDEGAQAAQAIKAGRGKRRRRRTDGDALTAARVMTAPDLVKFKKELRHRE